MQRYKTVPIWWYLSVFLAMFGISIAFFYVFDTGLPWYGLLLAIVIDVALLVPTGLMAAVCNITLSTVVLSAFIAGYLWPGKMVNNVVFKIFTIVSSYQGLGYVQNMKLGHYMVRTCLHYIYGSQQHRVTDSVPRKSLQGQHLQPSVLVLSYPG